ncbi:hypothetical protein JBE04_17710 [Streptomyces sp. PRKS01-29]|nr:hypothetical protein [Streptomyces sabulosicollis]MBI0296249.1 hypothetical protein [Streptomyces sabulosicollis]
MPRSSPPDGRARHRIFAAGRDGRGYGSLSTASESERALRCVAAKVGGPSARWRFRLVRGGVNVCVRAGEHEGDPAMAPDGPARGHVAGRGSREAHPAARASWQPR